MSKARPARPGVLQLTPAAQLTLTGLLLTLMTEDAEFQLGIGQEDRARARRARRDQLRFAVSLAQERRGHHDELAIEQRAILEKRLRRVRNKSHGLMILVTAAMHQPYLTSMPKEGEGRLDSGVRREGLNWAAGHLGLKDKVRDRALNHIDPQWQKVVLRRAAQVAVVGGAAWLGVATAGTAAPAIGAALGSTMGLSGAAATSAGLAALGGSSLAAGGMGMASGTMLIGALGGAGGAGLGALLASGVNKGELAAQAQALGALIHAAAVMDTLTRRRVFGQVTLIELEIAELIARRAHETLEALASGTAKINRKSPRTKEIEALIELRRTLPLPTPFELP